MSSVGKYVYHFKPETMFGSELVPLNALKRLYPDSYDHHVKKYQGREDLLEERFATPDLLWNDFLHLSPILPSKLLAEIKELVRETGHDPTDYFDGGRCFSFKIPIELLTENATYY